MKNSEKINLDNIPYVSTYSPNYPNDVGIVKDAVSMLKKKETTSTAYKNKSLLLSKRQPANLKNILTNAKFVLNEKFGVFKCETPRCKLCTIIITGNTFLFKNNITFNIKSHMTCNTLNCIYVIKCNGCNDLYIGETNNLRLRTNLHRDHANKNCGLAVSKHIYNCTESDNKANKFRIMPFYKLNKDETNYRRNMELHFINKYKPQLNKLF